MVRFPFCGGFGMGIIRFFFSQSSLENSAVGQAVQGNIQTVPHPFFENGDRPLTMVLEYERVRLVMFRLGGVWRVLRSGFSVCYGGV